MPARHVKINFFVAWQGSNQIVNTFKLDLYDKKQPTKS